MIPCRLIVDPPQDGAWNMAVDEALLDDAADRGVATLRFYRWSEPTLSLGYFQTIAERVTHAASREAAAVRRLSGGGALLHDRELTYSLSLPAVHPAARQPPVIYDRMHRALIGVLAGHGIHADLWGSSAGDDEPAPHGAKPFLCFTRRTAVDVVLPAADGATVKIAGSAQRRRRGAVLQHGALLLAASPAAPELAGLLETTGAALDVPGLAHQWAAAAAEELQLELQAASLDARLVPAAKILRNSKYAADLWTGRR